MLLLSQCGIWAFSKQDMDYSTHIRVSQARKAQAAAVPESNTMVGFGAALVLNGLGAVGTRYYLRRRYSCENAWLLVSRYTVRLPMYMDAALSILVMLAVSPVLLAIAAAAFRSGNPKVYGQPLLLQMNRKLYKQR